MRRTRSPRRHARTLTRSAELAFAAPAVIAARSARMLAAGSAPSAADRREMLLMGTEKVQAFAMSYFAMAAALQRLQLEWWMRMLRAASITPFAPASVTARDFTHAWLDVVGRGIVPIHRTATANARRLRRRR